MNIDHISIPKVDRVNLIDRFGSKKDIVCGTLYITTTHLIFVVEEDNKEIWVLHSLVFNVERGSISVSGCPLTVRCKHFLVLSFVISRDRDCQQVLETLQRLSQPASIGQVYAFVHVPTDKNADRKQGWRPTEESINAEFRRQEVSPKLWGRTDFNTDYQYCDTYPQVLYVPSSATKHLLIGSSKFRSRGRLPVLSYYNQSNQAVICRCSQPLSGFSARCVEDESLMTHILRTNPISNVLYIVDTRPKVNAMVNKAQGKGFEDQKNYTNICSYFFAIENIHVMRSSLQKLIEVCANPLPIDQHLSGLESSGWLKHIKTILESGCFIAESICKGISCVVHCSDGWDRTAQAISIACILLDPFYRTIEGFRVLIEKDWIFMGHKFTDRCGHIAPPNKPSATYYDELTNQLPATKEVSPIFLQFLDACWQLMGQFYAAFEFNERFLIEIHEYMHNCQFGTFLGNCDKDRKDLRVSETTYSLWAYIEKNVASYQNPYYNSSKYSRVLVPEIKPQMIHLWAAMYNRWDVGIHPRESIVENGISFSEHLDVLEDIVQADKILGVGRSLLNKNRSKSPSNQQTDSGHCSSASSSVHASLNAYAGGSKSDADPFPENSPSPSTKRDVKAETKDTEIILTQNNNSLAIRWQPVRSSNSCSYCGNRFGVIEQKLHCHKCGIIYCRRCLSTTEGLIIPSKTYMICKSCVKL